VIYIENPDLGKRWFLLRKKTYLLVGRGGKYSSREKKEKKQKDLLPLPSSCHNADQKGIGCDRRPLA